jgi:hypothetical protein
VKMLILVTINQKERLGQGKFVVVILKTFNSF